MNTFIVELEEENSPQKNRTRPESRNKKGITIQEEEYTVRKIPSDNQGKTKGKRYSEEPSWLDRYMSENADEEFLEEFYATLDNEMERISPSQNPELLTVGGGSDQEFDMIQQRIAELNNMDRNTDSI